MDKGGKSVDIKAYRNMIGVLLYLMTSRPEIMFSVAYMLDLQQIPRNCT